MCAQAGTIIKEKRKDINAPVIAWLKKSGETFEVFVDCEKAIKVKRGEAEVEDALTALAVFKDAKKGERAPDLEKVFGTEDVIAIAGEIIKKGEIQTTVEYRKKQLEKKKLEIIELISKRAFDPKTKLPIPKKRIELGMDQINYHVDPGKDAVEQVKDVISGLSVIMPISIQEIKIRAIVPAKYAMKAYGVFHKYGKPSQEEWHSDGSLTLNLKIPSGLKLDLYDELNSFSHGEISITEE